MKDNKLVNYCIILIGIVTLAFILKTFQQVLRPLAIAILLFFISAPIARFSKKRKIPTWITFPCLAAAFIMLLSLIGSFVSVENIDLETALPEYQEKIAEHSSGVLEVLSKFGYNPEGFTGKKVGQLVTKAAGKALGAVRTIFSEILMALILLMFLVKSVSALFNSTRKKHGEKGVKQLEDTFKRIENDTITYFSTKTFMSLGTALGTWVVLFLFGAKFVALSLLIVFALNFIPIIGSFIAVLILVLLYIASFGLSASVAWFFILLMIVQIIFGSILEPKITGDKLSISPIVIILSLYVWGWIWGIIGMLLSVPLTILIMIFVKHLGSLKAIEGPN